MPVERLRALREHYVGPSQSFVLFPDGGHVVVTESACAVTMYQSFIRDPGTVPDTACLATVPVLSLKSTVEQSKSIFGTDDLWGDAVGSFDWLLFASLFRFPALLIGIGVPFFAAFRSKKARGGSRPPSWIGTIAMLGLWVVLSTAVWMGMFVLPLLFRYDMASVSALAIAVVHVAIGAWLVKRWSAPKRAAS